jgi:hypothetical protein
LKSKIDRPDFNDTVCHPSLEFEVVTLFFRRGGVSQLLLSNEGDVTVGSNFVVEHCDRIYLS